MFMNVGVFPSIFPSTATGAMLVMVSSMSGNANSPAMRLIDAKYDDGTDVVRKVDLMQSCRECKRKGMPEKCPHIGRGHQHFQSVASMARIQKLLNATNPDAYKVEMEYVLLPSLSLFLIQL